MTVQITIIGLGQIGASIGLALARQKELLALTGHDIDYATARKAQQMGAVQKAEINLPASVRNADVIILAMPLKAVLETLDLILPDLRENVVILDTAPIKNSIAEWARQHLPENRHYVGLVPAINPAYLHETASGQDAAHADLFEKGLMGIVSPPGTPGEAIKLAADITRLLGAAPMFVDLAESDGLMSTVHILPQLMSAALANATVEQPGWMEMRKLAARPFAAATGLTSKSDLIDGLPATAMSSRENAVRALNRYLQELVTLRDLLNQGDEKTLENYLQQAQQGHDKWLAERERGDWLNAEFAEEKTPSLGYFMKRMFVGERPAKKK